MSSLDRNEPGKGTAASQGEIMKRLGSLLTAATVLASIVIGTGPAQAVSDRLTAGQRLGEGSGLVSRSGQHRLYVGSLTFDEGLTITGDSCDEALLADEVGGNENNLLQMQPDGNLVLYTGGRATWASRTVGNPGAFAVLQDDRNLVVYAKNGRALWSSRTTCNVQYNTDALIGDPQKRELRPGHYMQSPDRRYKLVMQSDGNLVLYGPTGRATWASRTAGNAGARFVLQPDNNLVVYSATGRPVWNSGTSRGSAFDGEISGLVLQNDGNLVLYKIAGWDEKVGVRWHTKTSGVR